MGMFNIVDAVAAILVLVGVLGGLRRGLSGELARVIAAAAALFVAWKFAQPLADWLMEKQPMSAERGYAMSFLVILAGTLALAWLLRAALRSVMLFAFKGRIERVGGALCGLVRASLVVGFIVLMVSLAPAGELRETVCRDSAVGSAICKVFRPMYDELREQKPELPLPGPLDDAAGAAAGEAEGTNDFVITDVEDDGGESSP